MLDLAPGQRSAWHRKRVAQVAARLGRGGPASAAAAGLREEAGAFAAGGI